MITFPPNVSWFFILIKARMPEVSQGKGGLAFPEGINNPAGERSEQRTRGSGVLPGKFFCYHALQIGLKQHQIAGPQDSRTPGFHDMSIKEALSAQLVPASLPKISGPD